MTNRSSTPTSNPHEQPRQLLACSWRKSPPTRLGGSTERGRDGDPPPHPPAVTLTTHSDWPDVISRKVVGVALAHCFYPHREIDEQRRRVGRSVIGTIARVVPPPRRALARCRQRRRENNRDIHRGSSVTLAAVLKNICGRSKFFFYFLFPLKRRETAFWSAVFFTSPPSDCPWGRAL